MSDDVKTRLRQKALEQRSAKKADDKPEESKEQKSEDKADTVRKAVNETLNANMVKKARELVRGREQKAAADREAARA